MSCSYPTIGFRLMAALAGPAALSLRTRCCGFSGTLAFPIALVGRIAKKPLLQGLLGNPAHDFWPDALSWDAAGVFVGEGLLHHGQITGTYLLALAVHHEGTLVSFEKRLSCRGVRGRGEARLLEDRGT